MTARLTPEELERIRIDDAKCTIPMYAAFDRRLLLREIDALRKENERYVLTIAQLEKERAEAVERADAAERSLALIHRR